MERRALKIGNSHRSKRGTSSNKVIYLSTACPFGMGRAKRPSLVCLWPRCPSPASDHSIFFAYNVLFTHSTKLPSQSVRAGGNAQSFGHGTRIRTSSGRFRFTFIKISEEVRRKPLPKNTNTAMHGMSTPPTSLRQHQTDRSSSGVGVAGIGRVSYVLLSVWR